jgi:hypothetical protein
MGISLPCAIGCLCALAAEAWLADAFTLGIDPFD